jgi:hypothetical protein
MKGVAGHSGGRKITEMHDDVVTISEVLNNPSKDLTTFNLSIFAPL